MLTRHDEREQPVLYMKKKKHFQKNALHVNPRKHLAGVARMPHSRAHAYSTHTHCLKLLQYLQPHRRYHHHSGGMISVVFFFFRVRPLEIKVLFFSFLFFSIRSFISYFYYFLEHEIVPGLFSTAGIMTMALQPLHRRNYRNLLHMPSILFIRSTLYFNSSKAVCRLKLV